MNVTNSQASNVKFLVLFALRGTLIERVLKRDMRPDMIPPSVSYEQGSIWIRPFATRALHLLQSCPNTHLGIFSSATYNNTVISLECAFPGIPFDVVLSRDHAIHDASTRSSRSPMDMHATFKDLRCLWTKESARSQARYDPSRTVVIDEEASKMRWHADNLLCVPPYGFDTSLVPKNTKQHCMSPEDTALLQVAKVLDQWIRSEEDLDVRCFLPRWITRTHQLTLEQK